MNIGYARVSTHEQNLDLQIDSLKENGCEKNFTDKISGSETDRPGLTKALQFAREGDTLVVWKLDRMSRSLRQLIEIMNELSKINIGIKSITESIDTSSPSGKLIFHIFSSLAEFERDIIKARTLAGLESARSRGKFGGRPQVLTDEKKEALLEITKKTNLSISEIIDSFHISRSTYYRLISKSKKDSIVN